MGLTLTKHLVVYIRMGIHMHQCNRPVFRRNRPQDRQE